jgi:hypothetical protein
MDASLPDIGPAPSDEYDPNSQFWQHELLHRATVQDYQKRIRAYLADRDVVEKGFVEGGLGIASASAKKRAKFSANCFAQGFEVEANWYERVKQIPATPQAGIDIMIYSYAWNNYNKQANMPKDF